MAQTCLLFDLDGTLVDSLPDLTTAINLLRADLGLPPLAVSRVRSYIGDGATALVRRALPEGAYDPEKLERFLSHYHQHLCELSTPYPGIPEMLENLGSCLMAVVTNKPHQMAIDLIDALGLARYFQLVLGGDSCSTKKPDPAPLLETLRQLHTSPKNSLMIGDHHTDLRAAKAAGIPACFCTWGYGNQGGDTPDYCVSSVAELGRLLVSR
ncbi:HAD family hydrolase [Geopsychrobacter electrodiphilus]|uniref:HAD family hydrolase n=1 Tax=Geopsychrobacter electrodiphilus TaxID=225196 RepID=UPI0003632049|nr:HAD-IA family hydrolase [Geopsychrobacter electrodiphilus]